MNRLVIDSRLVVTFIKILNSLYMENMSVNEIIEQTSSDRTFVIKALMDLEKAEFINTIKSKSHKQKKFKQLTKLGQEIANLTFNIENFNSEYFKLNKVIDEYKELDKKIISIKKEKNKPITKPNKTIFRIFPTKDRILERFLKEKLKEKEWPDTEISYYEGCKEGLYYTGIYLHEGIIKILSQKFLFIIVNFSLNVAARKIINGIIIENFQIQLSNIVTNIRDVNSESLINYSNTKDYSQYLSFKYDPLDYIDKLRFPFSSPVLEIVEKMMFSYIQLLRPSKRRIILILRNNRKNFENSPTYEIDEGDITKEELMMNSRCLNAVYKKYIFSD